MSAATAAMAAARQQQVGWPQGGREGGRGGEGDSSRPSFTRRGGIYAPGNKGRIVPDGVRVCTASCECEGTLGAGKKETVTTAFFLGLGWINA